MSTPQPQPARPALQEPPALPALPAAAPQADPQAVRQAEDAAYYRRLLHGVLDVCAKQVRRIETQVDAQLAADAEPAPDLTIQLERVARTMRRTIALARKIGEPAKARAADGSARRRFKARSRILRDVTDIIQRRAETEPQETTLLAELDERIDSPDLLDDIEDRPIEDIITDLVRDLGLAHLPGTHPWTRRTPKDVAALTARAAAILHRSLPPAQASP